MSSTEKTPYLNLNKWAGSDTPKRADFNYDNETIDTVVGTHINNPLIHISDIERDKWNVPFDIGSYIGDGANNRVIKLDFTPKILIIYANCIPFSVYDKEGDKMYSFGGFATELYASPGIYLEENAVTVTDSLGVPVYDNYYPRMNTLGYRYQYIAFK